MYLYKEAESKWIKFLDSKIEYYSFKRNYDYGSEKDNYVSRLSPFITHRVLYEYKLIKDIKVKYKGDKANKFIEEIYWRIYWKGYLENKSCIWENFIARKNYDYDSTEYEKALNGETHLNFFNSWIIELKTKNYLHNHTRMWFASTWIFNLCLPWELGAKLFFKYLYDGDAASNLLSWRWVAGLHTKGKKYLFSPSNLKKFANNRYSVENIQNKDIVLDDDFEIVLNDDIYKSNTQKSADYLIMFENDMDINTLKNLIRKYKKVFLIRLENNERLLKISEAVISFKNKLTNEFASQFDNLEIINSSNLINHLKTIDALDLIYPCVGDNYEFIKRIKRSQNKKINNLVREEDLYAWKFAKKGFFKFKENIPKINKFIHKPENLWK